MPCANVCRKIIFLAFFYFISFFYQPVIAAELVRLQLADKNDGILFEDKIDPDAGFAIRYIHSVAKTPVTDFFKIKNNQIILDKTVYQDFGAGLPHYPEENQKMSQKNGKIIISGYDRPIPNLQVRVGRIAEHTLILVKDDKKREIPLKDLASPGSAITFLVKPLNEAK